VRELAEFTDHRLQSLSQLPSESGLHRLHGNSILRLADVPFPNPQSN
jgi:hypothetical protein